MLIAVAYAGGIGGDARASGETPPRITPNSPITLGLERGELDAHLTNLRVLTDQKWGKFLRKCLKEDQAVADSERLIDGINEDWVHTRN